MPANLPQSRFPSKAAMDAALADLLCTELAAPSVRPRGLLLSGGSTPLTVYETVAQRAPEVGANVYVALTDERHVPTESPESNFGRVQPMVQALGIPEKRVFHVRTCEALQSAANRYDAELESFLTAGGQFVLALLGLGVDGHTCSLFTRDDLDRAGGNLATAVPRDPGPGRVSITPYLLEKTHRAIFAVSGPDKREILCQFLEEPHSTIAGQATARCPHVEIWHAEVLAGE